MYSSMTDNDLFPVLQSAYRKGHSTETALLRVVNDILSNMNKQQSAALDTVDHAILLGQHETAFSITDAALAWFASYLSGRSQRVSVNGERSDCYPLPFGVPQGSCLGPLLFSAYASKLFQVIKPCTCPTLTHSLTILSFIFPSTRKVTKLQSKFFFFLG